MVKVVDAMIDPLIKIVSDGVSVYPNPGGNPFKDGPPLAE